MPLFVVAKEKKTLKIFAIDTFLSSLQALSHYFGSILLDLGQTNNDGLHFGLNA